MAKGAADPFNRQWRVQIEVALPVGQGGMAPEAMFSRLIPLIQHRRHVSGLERSIGV